MSTQAHPMTVYTREHLPRLSLLTAAAWANLARGRTLTSAPARLASWQGLELALCTAAMHLGTVAFAPTCPMGAAASTPEARLNVSGQTLTVVAFEIEFTVARAEGKASDEWLAARAPRVLGRPPWQAYLDTALFRLGRPLEQPPLPPVPASGLSPQLGAFVQECVCFLMSLCARPPFQALCASYGAAHLQPYLVSLLDAALMDLDVLSGKQEPSAAPLLVAVPHLRALRAQLAAWSTVDGEVPEELGGLARRALEAAEYPAPPEDHPFLQLPC